ncbi:MAG: BTAD domain-containing putative transcriptional regulator [Solirubrobacteraceae bacterium]
MSQLRKALGEGGAQLLTRAPGYVLSLERGQLDLQRFERLVREAAAAEPPAAARKLREALALWRGPPLADLAYESFAQAAIGRLGELRLGAIEKRIDADLALGRHGELVAELEELVAENPLREHLRAQLMLALYRCGRQADALEVYRRMSTELSAELGLEPGRELKELESAILNQDRSLESPSTATDGRGDEPAPDREPPVEVGALRRARKVVTVLFCDVTGSTALGEELDPEALFGVMSRYFEELRAIIERHGGTVAKLIGDAVMGVFGIPRVHEEDALRAVRAAAEIRTRLPGLAQEVGVELRFRTGVNTGLVLVGDGENLAIGDAVNVAARLEHAAQPGEILLGEATHRLVRDAVEVEPLEALSLTGGSEPVAVFRLLAVDLLAPGLARRFDVPLIGRERELGAVREAWNRAVAENGCHLFTLLGAAGVGKSRLVAELLSDVGDEARVLAGRCLPYGEGITFWPLLEALTGAGEETEAVLERLRSGGTATPHELFLEVRLALESLAADRPVLVHVDDLQWAEPLLLDLLDHTVELSRDAPILLLCTARPELLEDRPAWGVGKLNATTMMLEPLGTAECEALLVQLGDDLDPPARARVVSASEGNPLFLEEMSALARETGSHEVPSTIQALLAARLERLAGEEREVLERGAVEGEVFHRGLARAIAGGERSEVEIDELLAGLVRKDLIRPHPPTLPGDRAFRFRHLLIRDAAYESLPKAARAELHERLARALERAAPDLTGLDEIAGWHLEQAIRYRRELGREVSVELTEAASEHLHAAGLRARERRDVMAAKSLLARAPARARKRHPPRSYRARPRRATDRGRRGRPGR